MKRLILCIFLILGVKALQAQFTVRIIVTAVATKPDDAIYLTGNFNNWNPRDEAYQLKSFGGGRRGIVLKNLAAGTYAFKFSRGSNDQLETTADGRYIPDRVLEVKDDLDKTYTIAGWKDAYPEVPKKYTASPQVRILDTAFPIPQLHRTRRIWIYLPKGYAQSDKRYPVIYMQDGQNLFNEQTAFAGEWGMDECLDSLYDRLGQSCIVVGIDHAGEKRINEYNPWNNASHGKGEGVAYADFLAHTLKPFIDQHYRTRPDAAHTAVGGSSMGALISLYCQWQYPDIFGGVCAFSPSLWIAPEALVMAQQFQPATQPACYLYVGGKEPPEMMTGVRSLEAILQKKQSIRLRTVYSPLGQHRETYWRQELYPFFRWWFQSFP